MKKTYKHQRVISLLYFLLLLTTLTAGACKKELAEPACDGSRTPVVFVHGFLASGDTYADQLMRFAGNRYCQDRLFVFDWNTLAGASAAIPKLDAYIDTIMARTGAQQVHLVGHSAGGGLGYAYLSVANRAAKVARYVHLGSGVQPGPAGPGGEIPTLNIYSTADLVVPGGDINGASNKRFTEFDHYQVATAPAVFAELYAFFNDGREATQSGIQAQEQIKLSGRVLTLGENVPKAGASIEVYAVNASTGVRLRSTPEVTLVTDETGHWGPWQALPGVYYEFFVQTGTAGDRPIHYYREPFVRSNQLVYLRTLPPAGSLPGLLLGGLPKNDQQSVLAIFSASKGIISPRDELRAGGTTLSTAQLTPAAKSIIAMFLYDNGDSQSGLTVHPTFQLLQNFLTGVDFFIPTFAPQSIQLELNGRQLHIPNWKSETQGISVAVFD
jgi:pimeloyl-ACP methyl ester carboxylesterase